MKERPIIFTGEMVRAILDGRKTQTRRVYKPKRGFPREDGEVTPTNADQWVEYGPCPYGQLGDRMWVKETHAFSDSGFPDSPNVIYRADDMFSNCWPGDIGWNWSPSIFMPRWASRITLEIAGVRVERLQDISEEDAKAEGLAQMQFGNDLFWKCYCKMPVPCGGEYVAFRKPKDSFESLWESINGPGSWHSNPFVWVIEFRKESKP